jgi:hypothetical protein
VACGALTTQCKGRWRQAGDGGGPRVPASQRAATDARGGGRSGSGRCAAPAAGQLGTVPACAAGRAPRSRETLTLPSFLRGAVHLLSITQHFSGTVLTLPTFSSSRADQQPYHVATSGQSNGRPYVSLFCRRRLVVIRPAIASALSPVTKKPRP